MLADPPRSLYLLLIVLVLVTGGVWAKYQSRRTVWPFAVASLLLLGLYLCDFFIESPREEAVRRVQAMTLAAEAGNEAAFMSHVSPQAKFDRPIPWHLIHQYQPKIQVWDFNRDDATFLHGQLTLGFMAKAEASGGGMMLKYVQAQFMEEPDRTWKLRSVTFFNSATRQPEPLP